MLTPLTPITRLVLATVKPTAANAFQLVHDLDDATWVSLYNRWLRKAKRLDSYSLRCWIKDRKPTCICVTKAEYEQITAGKAVAATKEEYEAENN